MKEVTAEDIEKWEMEATSWVAEDIYSRQPYYYVSATEIRLAVLMMKKLLEGAVEKGQS